MKNEPVKKDFLSTQVRLLSFRAFKRNCVTCCNPDECREEIDPAVISEINFPPCYLRNLREVYQKS
jgi:hypothetical protein